MRRVLLLAGLLVVALAGLFLLAESQARAPEAPSPATAQSRAEPEVDTRTLRAANGVGATAPSPAALLPSHPEAPPPAWRGRVVDASDQPIAGARVGLLPVPRILSYVSHAPPPENPQLFAQMTWVQTAADGRFELPWAAPPADTDWGLLVRHVRHVSRLVACKDALASGGDAGTLRLAPACIVRGRALAADGSPAAGATIDAELRTWTVPLLDGAASTVVGLSDGLLHADADDAGRFVLGGLPAATFTLEIEHVGYLRWQSDSMELASGGDVDAGDVTLSRGHTVAGRVVDAQDRPVAGAEVRLAVRGLEFLHLDEHGIHFELEAARTAEWGRGDRHAARACVTTSGADGRFELGGIETSWCAVIAAAPGFDPAAVDDVTAGTRDLVLRLTPLGRLRVRVVDAVDGRPIEGAELRVQRVADPGFQPRPDADLLPVARLPSGEFLVNEACSAPLVASVKAPQLGFVALRLDGLEAGSIEGTRELRCPRPASIAGRVVDSGGQPLASARVRLQPYSDRGRPLRVEPLDLAVSGDGAFQSGPLPADDWVVTATEPSHWFASARLALAPGDQRATGDLMLRRPARVEARFLDGGGQPRARVILQLVAPDGPVSSAVSLAAVTTDDQGQAVLAAPPGAMRLEARDPAVSVDLGTLEEGETRSVLLQPQPPAHLSGVVRDASGPVAGARVDCVNRFGRLNAKADASGAWSLDAPIAGEVLLEARSPRGGVVARRLHLEAGETRVVELRFGAGNVHGRVVETTTGAPIVGVGVQAWCGSGNERLVGWTVKTDDEGRFELAGLDDGAWTVQAGRDGYSSSAEVSASLPADASHELAFDIARLGTLRGTVRTTGGAPVAARTCCAYLVTDGDAAHADVGYLEDDGTFRFQGVAPGAHELLVTRAARGFERRLDGSAAERLAWVRVPVRVDPGGDVRQDVILPPGRP